MKKLLFIAAVVLTSFTTGDDFCDGYKAGYCEGFKEVKGQIYPCPLVPPCPPPPPLKNSYKGGYSTGFVAGMAKANEK